MLDPLLDALGYVGQSLDKAGPRPLRGLLGGKPRELMSIVPFSDELGLTDPKDIQSGRNLTDKAGLTDPNSHSFLASAAGFGLEAALDPAAALGTTAGALKGAGMLHGGLKGAAQRSMPGAGRLGMMDVLPFPGKSSQFNRMADWIGPQHPANEGRQILDEAVRRRTLGTGGFGSSELDYNLMNLPANELQRIYQEISPGSKYFASGGEGVVLQAPEGHLTKISPEMNTHGHNANAFHKASASSPSERFWPATGRPQIPESLSPIRSNNFGPMESGINVEHMHRVEPLTEAHQQLSSALRNYTENPQMNYNTEVEGMHLRNDLYANYRDITEAMKSRFPHARAKPDPHDFTSHWNPWDVDEKNVSIIPGTGNMTIHDSGAIGGKDVMALLHSGIQPDSAMMQELMGSGAPGAVRAAMQTSLARGPRGGVPVPPHLMQARQEQLARTREMMARLTSGTSGGSSEAALDPSAIQDALSVLQGENPWNQDASSIILALLGGNSGPLRRS